MTPTAFHFYQKGVSSVYSTNPMPFLISIHDFDGPLDLMLHLIKDKKLDLFDLDMSELTNQYLKYLNAMETLHLTIASEYLSELASLIEYKSRRLLPKEEAILNDEIEEDPRDALVRRLIEYQKFKEVTPMLEELLEQRSQHYTKPQSEIPSEWINEDVIPQGMNVYDLLKSIQKMYQRIALQRPLQSKFTLKEVSVDDKIVMLRHLISTSTQTSFALYELLQTSSNMQECVTVFLALLDMARNAEINFTFVEEDVIINKGEYSYETTLA